MSRALLWSQPRAGKPRHGAPQATVDELQADVDELRVHRNRLFKGETARPDARGRTTLA